MRWWWFVRPKHRQRHRVDRFRIIWFNGVRVVWVGYLGVIRVDAIWVLGLHRIGLDRVGSVRFSCIRKH